MSSSKQIGLGPMGLERRATDVATTSNLVASADVAAILNAADVDLCALLDQAYRSEGHTAYGAAEMLGMSSQSYSKAIRPQYVDNPVMKRLGNRKNRRVLKAWLAMASERVGLTAMDSEQTRTLRDFFRVLRAVGE